MEYTSGVGEDSERTEAAGWWKQHLFKWETLEWIQLIRAYFTKVSKEEGQAGYIPAMGILSHNAMQLGLHSDQSRQKESVRIYKYCMPFSNESSYCFGTT